MLSHSLACNCDTGSESPYDGTAFCQGKDLWCNVSRYGTFVLMRFDMSCFVLSCLVLFCFVLFCFVLFCFVMSCLVLSCLVSSHLVSYCVVLYCVLLSCLVFTWSHLIIVHSAHIPCHSLFIKAHVTFHPLAFITPLQA